MITYRDHSRCDAHEILSLYASVGWTNYTAQPEMLERAFAHSLAILAAYDGERLIGIIRAVGDGASIVFVQDLLVHPDYQRRGIGSTLLKMLLVRYSHVYQFELLTDDAEKTNRFYQSVGFQPVEAIGCRAFIRA